MVTVSLTSTYNRLELCRATLMSLANQSFRPDKIIVWLSDTPYLRDKGVKDCNISEFLTLGMSTNAKNIISVKWVENTGPYRKLTPFLQSDDDCNVVVTADDDIVYGSDWLKELMDGFCPDDRVIHAARVRKKRKNFLGKLCGYIFWPLIDKPSLLSDDWVITYGGGAVLCKSWFERSLINDVGYLNVAPTADDLWYSKLSQLSGLKVKVIPEALVQLNFLSHSDGLVNHNMPINHNLISRLKYKLLDYPLNYFSLVRFGNDKAHNLIEQYFSNKS